MPLKVLVIDSDKGAIESIKSLLTEAMYEVICSPNFKKAMKILEETYIDLILCATSISKTCGFSFVQNLTQKQDLAFIPVILLADKISEEDIDKANSVGADGYMSKPIKASVLLSAVEKKLIKFGRIILNADTVESESSAIQNINPVPKSNLTENDYLFRVINGRPTFIKLCNIKYITAQGAYSKVLLEDGRTYKIKKTLADVENIIPGNKFIRIHRSHIINLDFVDKIEKWFNNSYRVYLKNLTEPLEMSRRYSSIIKNRFYF